MVGGKFPLKPLMQVVVSLTLLVSAVSIIFSPSFASPEKHWAYGIVGTLIGFWLRQ